MKTLRAMTIKYNTKCSVCGKKLEAGVDAWGEKNDISGKWLFVCKACKGNIDAAEARIKARSEGMAETIEAHEFQELPQELLDELAANAEPVSLTEAVEMVTKKTGLAAIIDGAAWRI